jgi:hypothetical protein
MAVHVATNASAMRYDAAVRRAASPQELARLLAGDGAAAQNDPVEVGEHDAGLLPASALSLAIL